MASFFQRLHRIATRFICSLFHCCWFAQGLQFREWKYACREKWMLSDTMHLNLIKCSEWERERDCQCSFIWSWQRRQIINLFNHPSSQPSIQFHIQLLDNGLCLISISITEGHSTICLRLLLVVVFHINIVVVSINHVVVNVYLFLLFCLLDCLSLDIFLYSWYLVLPLDCVLWLFFLGSKTFFFQINGK